MKKIMIVLLALVVLAVAGMALAGVSNTRHDVRVLNTNSALEPCAYCHTPHGGNNAIAPLWNRSQLSVQTYTVYTSTSFDMGAANVNLDKGSAPCMVCHNGAASQLINYPGRASTQNSCYNTVSLTGWSNLGVNLQNEHPVSFTYNDALDDATEGNGFPAAAGGTIPATGISLPLYGRADGSSGGTGTELSCASCHSVHHTPANSYNTGVEVYFLRTSNAGSYLCGRCHVNRL